MRFFSDLTNKLFWFVLGVIFLSFGYLFVIRNFLNPPKISTVPSIPPQTTPNPQVVSHPSNVPSSNPVDWQPNLDRSQTKTSEKNPLDWQPNLDTMPAGKVIEVPKRLTKGAILYVYENEIDETNPDPDLYRPKLKLKMPSLRLVEWFDSEFQNATGFFYVPEDGTYKFAIEQVKKLKLFREYKERNLLKLSINGTPFKRYEGGTISLEKGWHYVNLYFNPLKSYLHSNVFYRYPKNLDERLDIWISDFNVNWGKEGNSLTPLVTYRAADKRSPINTGGLQR